MEKKVFVDTILEGMVAFHKLSRELANAMENCHAALSVELKGADRKKMQVHRNDGWKLLYALQSNLQRARRCVQHAHGYEDLIRTRTTLWQKIEPEFEIYTSVKESRAKMETKINQFQEAFHQDVVREIYKNLLDFTMVRDALKWLPAQVKLLADCCVAETIASQKKIIPLTLTVVGEKERLLKTLVRLELCVVDRKDEFAKPKPKAPSSKKRKPTCPSDSSDGKQPVAEARHQAPTTPGGDPSRASDRMECSEDGSVQGLGPSLARDSS